MISPNDRLNICLIGAGSVGQAMHLPYLAQLHDRFRVAAVVDPSAAVREAIGQRHPIGRTYEDYREALDGEELDAVLISSPAATHCEIALAALDAGLHVLVEKPLSLTLEDADKIITARDRAKRIVQVAYMNRFDPSVERMQAALPRTTSDLRYVNIVVNDPESGPFLSGSDVVPANDVPADVAQESRRAEAEQVEAAVGASDPATIQAFSEGYLGSLVHQVNLTHGLLETMGEVVPATVVDGNWWAEGTCLTGSVRLANGARWDSAWVQLVAVPDYTERITFYFEDSIHSLRFPSPWLRQSPTRYRVISASNGACDLHSSHSFSEAFLAQLSHFHDCALGRSECRTPPEQARRDIEVLTEMFKLASRETPVGSPV